MTNPLTFGLKRVLSINKLDSYLRSLLSVVAQPKTVSMFVDRSEFHWSNVAYLLDKTNIPAKVRAIDQM